MKQHMMLKPVALFNEHKGCFKKQGFKLNIFFFSSSKTESFCHYFINTIESTQNTNLMKTNCLIYTSNN